MKIRFSSLAACSKFKVLENQPALPSGRLLRYWIVVTERMSSAYQMGLLVHARGLQYNVITAILLVRKVK